MRAKGHTHLRLWLRMLASTNAVERIVRARLREEFGITLPRFDVLAQLDAADDGLAMSELSRRLMVTNGNLTGLTERLVEEGLVTRTASPTDKRTQIVRLSRAGKRVFDRMAPRHEEWINEIFSGLRATELTQLHSLIGKVPA